MQKRVEFKVGLFVVLISLLIVSSILYLAYSKGFFTKEYIYALSSKSGEDLTEGMPVVFSGFKIGKVESLNLNDEGILLVSIRIPEQHVKWIRSDSKFSLYKPLIGSARLIVTTENMNSPPLPLKSIPELTMVSDINETIKRVQPTLDKVDRVLAHVENITANLANPEGDVNKILRHSERLTENLAKKDTLIEMAVGSKESVQAVNESLKKVRDMLAKTDEQVYGKDGVLPLVRTILKDVIVKLEKMNTAVDNLVKISGETAESTKDLKVLRTEIETTINSIGNTVKEIEKKIPFKKEPETIRLP
ncbi:MAG TPA: MlaD family protein [Syntrophales bacterium]|nr:MlaD family protein [Syntrophales bacterium]